MIKKCYKVDMDIGKAVIGRKRAVVLAVLAALGILASMAGCGGGGDDNSTGASGPVAGGEASGDGGAESPSGEGEGAGGEEPTKSGEPAGSAGAGGGSGLESSGSGSDGLGGESGAGRAAGAGGSSGLSGNGSRSGKSGSGKRGSRKERGSGEGSSGGAGDPRSEFIAEADAVCKRWGVRVKADVQRGFQGDLNGSPKQSTEAVESLAAALQRYVIADLEAEINEVRSLPVPVGAEEAAGAATAAIQQLIVLAQEDPQGFILTGQGIPEAEAIAKKQGFAVCGTLVGEPSITS